MIKRLGAALVRTSPSQPIADYLPALEKLIVESHATISDAFRKPQATVHDVVDALITEKEIGISTAKSGGAILEEGGELFPRGDAIEAAIRSEAFKRVANAVSSLNLSERLGRLDAMAAGFDGECVLTIRALCKPLKSSALTARVATLATLNDLHVYVPEYISWVLTADPYTGAIPRHRQSYSIVGKCDAYGRPSVEGQTFLSKLLNFDLATMDWVFSPGGLLAFKRVDDAGSSLADSSSSPAVDDSVHPLDVFTVPAVVEELGQFIHKVLAAIGASASPMADSQSDGVTFAQWTTAYVEHLKRVTRHATVEERYEFLEHCHSLFVTALLKVGGFLRGEVYSLLPAMRSINRGVLRLDDEPYTSMHERQAAHERVLQLRTEFPTFLLRATELGSSVGAFQVVLRSTNPIHKTALRSHTTPPGGKGLWQRKRSRDQHESVETAAPIQAIQEGNTSKQ